MLIFQNIEINRSDQKESCINVIKNNYHDFVYCCVYT